MKTGERADSADSQNGKLGQDATEVDSTRRNLALTLLGAFGASSLLKGCAPGDEASDLQATLDRHPDVALMEQALNGTTNIRWFDTIASMRAFSISPSTNYTAIVHGYATPGDGGGGVFVWSTTSAKDDGKAGTALYSGAVINPLVSGAINPNPAAGWRRIYSGPRDVRWHGAIGDGATACLDPIQVALNAADEVFIPSGSFSINGSLLMRDKQVLRGQGKSSRLISSASCAIHILNTDHSEVRDLAIICSGAGAGGILIEANADVVLYPTITRVQIDLPASGTCVGIDCYTAGLAPGAQIIYFPTIVQPVIQVAGAINPSSTGIRTRSQSGLLGSVGGRILNGRISVVCMGLDLLNCDTWECIGTAFDGCVSSTSGVPSTSNAGRAIKFGASAAQCAARGNRFEDCDVFYEVLGPACALETTYGFAVGQAIYGNSGDMLLNGKAAVVSRNAQQSQFARRALFGRSIEAGFYENAILANGANQSIADQSGVVSPTVRVTGPTAAFSIGSIKNTENTDPTASISGALKYVYNTTSQPLTIKHQDPSATVPAERIVTLTGSDIVVPGPAVLRFIYDGQVNGGGPRRWVFMGAG